MSSSKLVYSTSGNNSCPTCRKPLFKCRCSSKPRTASNTDGVVRIHRETKGRGGKEVTVISGLASDNDQLKKLAKKIKAAAGVGGSVKNGLIEIQGDKRAIAQEVLRNEGITSNLAGG